MSIERFSETSWLPPWVRYQHRARYEWVANQTRGLAVVDVACGEGAGVLAMALNGAQRVDGFDSSDGAIKLAQRRCQRVSDRIGVLATADAAQLSAPNDTYDVFVSLETIEHLADDASFLREVTRVLKPGGRFLCSTPNRAILNPGTTIGERPFNPFHVREYTQFELEQLLLKFFPSVEWFGQSFYGDRYVTLLNKVGRLVPAVSVKLHQIVKLVRSPFDRIGRHTPQRLKAGFVAEVLVAVCTK